MGRFHVLHCVHIRNFEYGKMRMNQGLSVFIGMEMEQGSQEGDYHQQSHRVPRDQFSHKRILTKRSSKVNRPDGSHRACHQITFSANWIWRDVVWVEVISPALETGFRA